MNYGKISASAAMPEFSAAEISKASRRRRDCCGSIICWTAGSAGSPAETGNASPSPRHRASAQAFLMDEPLGALDSNFAG